jgi:predicted Rossmann fold nucleotide-binding protein DprA/Smf involved in DNA uptake
MPFADPAAPTPPRSHRRRGRARTHRELRATSPCARAVYAALPGTSFDIAERAGYSVYAVRAALNALKHAGRVVRTPGHIWRQA